MAKTRPNLVAGIFTFVVIALLVALNFVPIFSVQATRSTANGDIVVFSTSVSVKDVLKVGFLSKEEREERLVETIKLREAAEIKLQLENELDNDEITAKVNKQSYSREYALLFYFSDNSEDAALGIAPSTWLLVAAILTIVTYVALAFVAIYSYLSMQYDNVHFPLVNRILAIAASVLLILLNVIFMFFLKDKVVAAESRTVYTFFGYVFALLALYLPAHVFITFQKRESFKKSKK